MTDASAKEIKPLSQLHLLLTYECNYECDHCFVWGGPSQGGTMTLETIEHVLDEAAKLSTIEWIYFEGGEPFLHYELLCSGVRLARQRGFRVGIVSNASWASSETKAFEWLKPFQGEIEDLSISDDDYHGREDELRETVIARKAAKKLDIPVGFISIAAVEVTDGQAVTGRIAVGESAVVYRGRAAEKLASMVRAEPWNQFDRCPWEDLRHPQRVHVDAYGNMHICQGISIGNLIEQPLTGIMGQYSPESHPIVGPLIAGGPAEIVNRYALPHQPAYADACHLCYLARCELRERFPQVLTPDQMYGRT